MSSLHRACQTGCVESVLNLIERNYNINSIDDEGKTPLIVACDFNHIKVVKILLKNNVIIDHKDNYGFNALMYVCYAKYFNIVKLLVDNGANINVDNEVTTPLMLASARNTPETAKYLIQHGADINFRNKFGETAVMQNYDDKITELLLCFGAKVTKEDIDRIYCTNIKNLILSYVNYGWSPNVHHQITTISQQKMISTLFTIRITEEDKLLKLLPNELMFEIVFMYVL